MIKQKGIKLIIISLFLAGCHPVNSEEPQAGTDVTAPEVIAAVEMKSELPAEGEVPWGFDRASYEVYKSGALDSFIPSGSGVEQCVSADLDLDGVDDILMCISIPPLEKPDDYRIFEYEMNTVILKGTGQNTYERRAENRQINYHSYYDGSAGIAAGDGWFRFSRARGTAGRLE